MGLPYAYWRSMLLPASYQGVGFHVDTVTQASGRRTVVHEFPHRDVPFTEDMGRKARRWTVNAYLVDDDYVAQRDALIAVLEIGGTGTLVLPTLYFNNVILDSYAESETRERGGICTFSLIFVEAGALNPLGISVDTAAASTSASSNLGQTSAGSINTATSQSLNSGGSITPAPASSPAEVISA